MIRTPANVVFDIIGHAEKVPEWYRASMWLPDRLTRASLSRWGEHIPARQRIESGAATSTNEIQIHWVRNREFGYRYQSRFGISFDSVFRLASKDKECTLIWDLRYKSGRWTDAALNRAIIERETSEVMKQSLDTICRLAESAAGSRSWQRRLLEARPVWRQEGSLAS
jgi:hypothetical protein